MTRLILCLLCVPVIAFAADDKAPAGTDPDSEGVISPIPNTTRNTEPPRAGYLMRNRSSYDAHVFVGGEGAIVFHGTGTGGASGINLRIKFGRCGAIAGWQTQKITIWDPGDVHNSILGLGAMCTVYQFPDWMKPLRGTHITISAMAERGETTYHVYEYAWPAPDRELYANHETAWGGKIGANFHFPLLWGFWLVTGFGREWLNFKYDLSSIASTGSKTRIENEVNYVEAGFRYGF